ncbi:MAG: chromosomal replication initiator protein DnaA [Phycisphaerales bacterium]|nr:MAG: chromosomal replication initiator protein DnaA [Phycisphaerales bacterium]
MATIPTTLWDDIVGQVRLNHTQLVRGWFNELALSSLDGGIIEIRALNGAQARYLRQHCQVAFAEAAQAATGRLVSVRFSADESQDPTASPSSHPFTTPDEELQLNPDCTFDHFVTGPCNRLAHAAALAIAQEPGRVYNPFFAHGPVGLGKTHLLQAICYAIREHQPQARFCYISCETFINHFIEAVESGALHHFRYRYRHVDGLVIDDVQFLAERERSQEEFFHTFNTLHQSHRQIILSADCSPSEIPSLEERLVSRFNSGLVALLDRPCFETRMAIVRKKAKLRCIEVPEEVVGLVASRIDTNIRELEGALIKIDALSQAGDGRITLSLAQEALGHEPSRPVTIPAILEVVARGFNVKVSDLQSKKRFKAVTHPRHICMFLARRLTAQSLEQIGGYFGGRDHTTVLHASRVIAEQVEASPEFEQLLDELAAQARNVS